MLDRESTFAVPETVRLLQSKFIPVALDQAYQRRQKDTEGDFYRKIASQGPRNNFNGTTQGFYIADAAGRLLLYNNNRDPQKLLRLIKKSLTDFGENPPQGILPIEPEKLDPRWNVSPPEGGLVLRVRAKILDGYKETKNEFQNIFQCAVSRDNLWVTKEEHEKIGQGEFPAKLAQRIARFHLVDNTRGEPPMWDSTDIRELKIEITDKGEIRGEVNLLNRKADRGYEAKLQGKFEVKNGKVVAMELVCLGDFFGEGRYTKGAPEGKFPLAITFKLADGTDIADRVPPQGSRGWLNGYLQ
ncbi:MAG: hypothetical protein AAF483_23845 [Planctomycetota bacterium]